jgi:hypothetical protein
LVSGPRRHVEEAVVMELPGALDQDGPEHLGALDERREIADIRELADRAELRAPEEGRSKLCGVFVGGTPVGRNQWGEPTKVVGGPDRERGCTMGELVVAFVALRHEDEGVTKLALRRLDRAQVVRYLLPRARWDTLRRGTGGVRVG